MAGRCGCGSDAYAGEAFHPPLPATQPSSACFVKKHHQPNTSCPSSLLLTQEALRSGKSVKMLLLLWRGWRCWPRFSKLLAWWCSTGERCLAAGAPHWLDVHTNVFSSKESWVSQVLGQAVKGTKATLWKVVWNTLGWEVKGKYMKRKQKARRIHPK